MVDKRVNDHIRDHLNEVLGLVSIPTMPSLEELKQSEWSSRFEQLMRNRMIMGAMRYGRLREPGKKTYDRVTSITQRMDLYRETGNQEHLVDVANLCLLEFEEPNHANAHFSSVDDGIHTEEF